jgi:hypothetical protein
MIQNRQSIVIASIFIIMTYSVAMPFMYLFGVLIFTVIYWSDKLLFLNYMRTPPHYTTELARRSYFIIEWAVILHLFFGLFMMSNPLIFNVESS